MDYVLIYNLHVCELCFNLFIFKQMAAYALLSGVIDRKHRAKIWEDGGKIPKILRTRGPAYNWMIHPAWVDRYV